MDAGTVPPPSIKVTVDGGRITVNGLRYTFTDHDVPKLPPGGECLLLLKRDGEKYRIALTYHGAYQIVDEKLEHLSSKQDFPPEFQFGGMPVERALSELLARLRAMPPNSVKREPTPGGK